MIEDYTINACPVIELEDLIRAELYLPSREKVNAETKSDTHVVLLDGDEEKHVVFDWDEEVDGWKLRNKLIVWPNDGIILDDCTTCGMVDHRVNKIVNRKKCMKCNVVTDLKL